MIVTKPVFNSNQKFVQQTTVFITDENVYNLHTKYFEGYKTIVISSGEKSKSQKTVNKIIAKLIKFNTDKSTLLVGVGGGVVTDITGYVATTFMRGIQFGFVPTTLLAMVDASIGGKNGVNFKEYKNYIGTIAQPEFIHINTAFLKTLPKSEWQNGFAEIIKHAAISNPSLFSQLEQYSFRKYLNDDKLLSKLIQKNIEIKLKYVSADVDEKGIRKVLNFGHTLGHAIEKKYELSHGQAIAIGMCFASKLSTQYVHFKEAGRVKKLVAKYGLPIDFQYNKEKISDILKADKKKIKDNINFILLTKIGKAQIKNLHFSDIEKHL